MRRCCGLGVEVEFDLPEGLSHADRQAAYAAIIADLRDAGLTTQTQIDGYHSAVDLGYTEDRDRWRLEADPTVDGELVSPILRDTPQTWADLATALEIIRRHGGRITKRTAGHVHVGTRQFGTDVRAHEALRALFTGYQPELFRLAMNPRADAQRGLGSARPLPADHTGYKAVWDTPSGVNEDALSFKRVQGGGTDHVEFRQADGSLSAGEIQQNVKLSLGLVHAALRLAADPAWRPPAYAEAGAHAGVGQRVRRSASGPGAVTVFEPDAPEVTENLRAMLDTVFWRQEDRDQAMARYAVTAWHGGRGAAQAGDASAGLLDPAAVPGLADLTSLGSVFVSRSPGAALFRSAQAVDDRDTAALADQLRSRVPGGDAFVALVALNRPPYVPNAFGFGGNRRLTPAEFGALLRELGWTPGTPLVIARPFEDTPAALVEWSSQLATELGQPVHVPATADEGAESVEMMSGRLANLAGYEILGWDGGDLRDHGDLVTMPPDAWFRLLPAEAAAAPAAQESAPHGRPTPAQLAFLAERGLHAIPTGPGDSVVHALGAAAPASFALIGGTRPATPAEFRAHLAEALTADLHRPPAGQRLWPLLDARFDGFRGDASEGDRRRALIAALTAPDGTPESGALTVAAASAVLGLRTVVVAPDGTTAFGPEDGGTAVLVRVPEPGRHTGMWAATGPSPGAGRPPSPAGGPPPRRDPPPAPRNENPPRANLDSDPFARR